MKPVGAVAGMTLLVVRGALLYVLVPAGILAWIGYSSWALRVNLGQWLGWLDLNMVAFLERVPLRPLFPEPTVRWWHAREIPDVTHRISVLDPL